MGKVLKIFAWILALLMAPVLAYWIYNQFDRAPSAKAREYSQPFVSTLPDARNAYLLIVGLGSAEGEDPIALGRRRVDSHARRVATVPIPPPTQADQALFRDAVSLARPPEGPALCDDREADCVAWAGENRELLARLEREKALLLRRHDTLLAMEEVAEVGKPGPVDIEPSPTPALVVRIDALHAYLAARDVAAGKDPSEAVAKLARSTRFWRRAETGARSFLFKLVAIHSIERNQRVLGAIVDRATPAQLAALQPHADVVLAPPGPNQHDFRPMIPYQYQLTVLTVRQGLPGTFAVLRKCVRGEQKDCPATLLGHQFYAPQATDNLLAEYWERTEPFQVASARDYRAVEKEVSAAITRAMPLGDEENITRFMHYNPVGEILAGISLPALNWMARNHDSEAMRRMQVLKLQAARHRVPRGEMRNFLGTRSEVLLNPYTGEPFGWDAAAGQIWFAPVAKYWEKERLFVPYKAR